MCIENTDESTSISDYYSSDEFKHNMCGSCAYGSTEEQTGIFDVQFDILEFDDDIWESTVKITNIDII